MQSRIKIYTEELLQEISDRLTVSAESNSIGDIQRDTLRDITEDGNRDIITRLVHRLMFGVYDLLFPFAKEPIEPQKFTELRGRDNIQRDVEAFIISLDFPFERSEISLKQLKENVHSYVVYKCVAEWMALAMPDNSQWQIWEQKANETRDIVVTSLVKPMRPKRLKVKPHYY
ncbi:MAG: hypothetical protein HUK08_07875 [Bacteroidaceae bacterium]|nr:hypothetical protein [Bacteroidaceae bacterium]